MNRWMTVRAEKIVPVRWARMGLALGLVTAPLSAAETDDTGDASRYHYQNRGLEQLSEQSVSRRGETALRLEGVAWDHGESDHFVFHFERGHLRPLYANQTERYYELIKRSLGVTNDTFQSKIHLFVFLGTNTWATFLGNTRADPWTGSFWTGRELFVKARANPKLQDQMLAHEMVHVTLQRFVGANLPLWLEEGFAEFEGTRQTVWYLRAQLKPSKVAAPPVQLLPQDRFLPLDRLTAAVDYPAEEEAVDAFYREAELLVKYLHDNHGGLAPLVKFLHGQNRGARFSSAMKEVYGLRGADLAEFERAFFRYATGPKP